jgi:hypothetical protein
MHEAAFPSRGYRNNNTSRRAPRVAGPRVAGPLAIALAEQYDVAARSDLARCRRLVGAHPAGPLGLPREPLGRARAGMYCRRGEFDAEFFLFEAVRDHIWGRFDDRIRISTGPKILPQTRFDPNKGPQHAAGRRPAHLHEVVPKGAPIGSYGHGRALRAGGRNPPSADLLVAPATGF